MNNSCGEKYVLFAYVTVHLYYALYFCNRILMYGRFDKSFDMIGRIVADTDSYESKTWKWM